jgi:hypothetical protein
VAARSSTAAVITELAANGAMLMTKSKDTKRNGDRLRM